MTDWPAETWRQQLASWLPHCTVEVVAELGSTNTELMHRARAGVRQDTLLVAQRQTAGRGRLGRSWQTEPDQALTFSLGLNLQRSDWSGLSLAVGVALAQSLHPQLQLKWPNDLWWQQRKLAGILIEAAHLGAQRYVVIGVGVNVGAPPASGLTTPPAWVQEFWPQASVPAVLTRVLPVLVETLQRFVQHGFVEFAPRFTALDGLRGRAVRLGDGTVGVAQGVDSGGALLVHTAQGVKSINSAEVSVRLD